MTHVTHHTDLPPTASHTGTTRQSINQSPSTAAWGTGSWRSLNSRSTCQVSKVVCVNWCVHCTHPSYHLSEADRPMPCWPRPDPQQSPSWPPSSTGRQRICRRSCSRYVFIGRIVLLACWGLVVVMGCGAAAYWLSMGRSIDPHTAFPYHHQYIPTHSSNLWSIPRRIRRTCWSGSRCRGSEEAEAAARRAGRNE